MIISSFGENKFLLQFEGFVFNNFFLVQRLLHCCTDLAMMKQMESLIQIIGTGSNKINSSCRGFSLQCQIRFFLKWLTAKPLSKFGRLWRFTLLNKLGQMSSNTKINSRMFVRALFLSMFSYSKLGELSIC